MPEIRITVNDKTACAEGQPVIVCGNNDYTVRFSFDSEWDASAVKTMRAVWYAAGMPQYADVLFEGDTAVLPAVYDTPEIAVGVYAGDIRTTTPARIPCACCINDRASLHPDPPQDVYDQLLLCLRQLVSGMPFAYSDTQAVSDGGPADDIYTTAEEVT